MNIYINTLIFIIISQIIYVYFFQWGELVIKKKKVVILRKFLLMLCWIYICSEDINVQI